MNRLDLINYCIEQKGYKKYLEIGCEADQTFNKVNSTYKIGVDPKSGGTIRLTSDDFFALTIDKFDLIFIDGLHIYEQVYRDIYNSLQCLNENGLIIVHDCLPENELMQRVPRETELWTGDVWRAILDSRTKYPYEVMVGDFDLGCAVINPSKTDSYLTLRDSIKDITFQEFQINKDRWLNIVNEEQLKDWIVNDNYRL